jgi:alkylation response protein AidB-like acyl-CoA dehydrogenase
MTHYRAPLQDYRFLIDEIMPSLVPGADAQSWSACDTMLEAAARFSENVLEPLNRSGDVAGCRYDDGKVHTPPGFRDAYGLLRDGGWMSATEGEDEGAISTVAAFCFDETVAAANLAFGNYLGPTKRVAQALSYLADRDLSARYLQPLLAGDYGGTLCLTEPECGTDLGLISTRAELGAIAGEYLISGTKIFVTAGEHDLTSNIIHLVLARIVGAPAGAKGLSLFLVPKLTPRANSNETQANGVRCIGIEHKMGLRASATCALQFERSRGILLGAPGSGLKSIFPIMERERLSIALQSVGVAEHAYQKALAYARERLQGRAARGPARADLPADPIIVHGDVRRMLLTMKVYTEGSRALLLWTGSQIDRARRETDPGRRQDALDFVQLLTPVVKAFATDLGTETANLGIQVMGGHGYICESGMEQLARDVRVTQLYAGANGIQALDLVARKLPAREGRMLDLFTSPMQSIMDSWPKHALAASHAKAMSDAIQQLRAATELMQEGMRGDPDLAGSAGYAYLQLFGHVALGFLWAHTAVIASARLDSSGGVQSKQFYAAKIAIAQFYLQHLLPSVERHLRSVLAGTDAIMRLDADAF